MYYKFLPIILVGVVRCSVVIFRAIVTTLIIPTAEKIIIYEIWLGEWRKIIILTLNNNDIQILTKTTTVKLNKIVNF